MKILVKVSILVLLATLCVKADPSFGVITLITNLPSQGTMSGSGTYSTGAVAAIQIHANAISYLKQIKFSGAWPPDEPDGGALSHARGGIQ